MIKSPIFIAALGIALTMASAPALAKSRAAHPGYAARAQATESVIGEGISVSLQRAQALRECSQLAEPVKVYSLVQNNSAVYRNCMYRHGEQE